MWNWPIWAALALGFVAIVWASVRVGRAVAQLVRDVNRTRDTVFTKLDAVAVAAERAADRADAVGAGSARLTTSVERLAESRRRLAVLAAAWEEVSGTVAAVSSYYPRK